MPVDEAEAPRASSSLHVAGDEGTIENAEIRVDGAEEPDAASSLLVLEAALAGASSAFLVVEAEVARLASELPKVGAAPATSPAC
ncbi:MAG TPA: hypothetical protein VF765_13985 [Polyangiaceae bacterium]